MSGMVGLCCARGASGLAFLHRSVGGVLPSAGANSSQKDGGKSNWTRNGFGGMAQRFTRKPLIGAIRGYALGGGCEMVMNLDIAVAGEGATFGFPEVKRGVVILAGGLERFVKLVGHQRGE